MEGNGNQWSERDRKRNGRGIKDAEGKSWRAEKGEKKYVKELQKRKVGEWEKNDHKAQDTKDRKDRVKNCWCGKKK